MCTLVTTTPDATLNTHVAVSLLAHSVLTEAIESIELVSAKALITNLRAPKATILAEIHLTCGAFALASDCI